jgi:predicted enzyme related to lactoylglutathione lyase
MSTKNPFTWIEIYVEDMARVQQFYESVLQVELVELPSPDGNTEMQIICFLWNENENDIRSALVKIEGILRFKNLMY